MIIVEKFIEKANGMETRDLEKLASGVHSILEKRKSGSSPQEQKLLREIKNIIPASVGRQYKRLHKKLQENNITEKEYQELVQVTDFIEEKSAERVKLLGELAALKKISLKGLMKQINLKKIHAKA